MEGRNFHVPHQSLYTTTCVSLGLGAGRKESTEVDDSVPGHTGAFFSLLWEDAECPEGQPQLRGRVVSLSASQLGALPGMAVRVGAPGSHLVLCAGTGEGLHPKYVPTSPSQTPAFAIRSLCL